MEYITPQEELGDAVEYGNGVNRKKHSLQQRTVHWMDLFYILYNFASMFIWLAYCKPIIKFSILKFLEKRKGYLLCFANFYIISS